MRICKTYLAETAAMGAMAIAIFWQPALAQSERSGIGSDDIIVTARKRDETSIAVPVVLTAVSGSELERRGANKLDDLAKIVPQLQMGVGGGNRLGGIVAIRGIAGAENNAFADQAVSFNVDGVQVAKALIRRMSEMDLAQVEVLKGPQALFFGKNSPGGIISLRSADPTDRFEAKASGGYEFNAREWRGDGFISGPLTDTLGARLAVYGTTMRGWFHNDVDGSDIYRSAPKRLPKAKEWAVRGTLKWQPSDRFDARLKVSYSELKDRGSQTTSERSACPLGTPQDGGGPDNCKLDGHGFELDIGPFLGSISPERFPKDGVPLMRVKQALIAHEMNYDLTDSLTLTSVSGYYYADQRAADMFNFAFSTALATPGGTKFTSNEFSQELRLASAFDGPVNFLLGGYYQRSNTFSAATSFRGLAPVNGVNPTQIQSYNLRQKGVAYSGFGQLMFKPLDKIEITAGGRYSFERKRLTEAEIAPAGPGPIPRVSLLPNPNLKTKRSWKNFSPEVSVSYRPSSDLTLFVNYKHGFLSGGFNGAWDGSGNPSFDQQKIKGFEGGVKARLFDGALRTNLSAYRYVVTGMQVTTSVLLANGLPQLRVLNAGEVTTKGIEFDFDYRTPLEGLRLRGAVGYNDAVYDVFSGACYRGQTQELGCNLGVPTTTIIGGQPFVAYNLQNLAGRQVLRAPKWGGSVGAGYESDVGSGLRFGLNADMTFSSSFDTLSTAAPHARQNAYQLIDAGMRIGAQDESWEVALIGKNLTNKYYFLRANEGTGGTTGGRAANDPRGNILGDIAGSVPRGREIMLRVTMRFGGS